MDTGVRSGDVQLDLEGSWSIDRPTRFILPIARGTLHVISAPERRALIDPVAIATRARFYDTTSTQTSPPSLSPTDFELLAPNVPTTPTVSPTAFDALAPSVPIDSPGSPPSDISSASYTEFPDVPQHSPQSPSPTYSPYASSVSSRTPSPIVQDDPMHTAPRASPYILPSPQPPPSEGLPIYGRPSLKRPLTSASPQPESRKRVRSRAPSPPPPPPPSPSPEPAPPRRHRAPPPPPIDTANLPPTGVHDKREGRAHTWLNKIIKGDYGHFQEIVEGRLYALETDRSHIRTLSHMPPTPVHQRMDPELDLPDRSPFPNSPRTQYKDQWDAARRRRPF